MRSETVTGDATKKYVQNAYNAGNYGHPVDELMSAGSALRYLAEYVEGPDKHEYGLAFILNRIADTVSDMACEMDDNHWAPRAQQELGGSDA